MWLHCCAVVISVICRALFCHTCTLQVGFSIPKPHQPPMAFLFGGFLLLNQTFKEVSLCNFYFPKMWNILLPIYTGQCFKLSDFFYPWASDGFEIHLKVIKQEAGFYCNEEGKDWQIILHMGQYMLSIAQCYQICCLKCLIGMFLIKLIPQRIVLMSTRERGCFCCWSLRLEGWEDGNVSMLK